MCQFHFSQLWAKRYAGQDPTNPLLGADFPDDDLTSYIRLINQCGIVLYGAPAQALLPQICDEEFFDAIAQEINGFAFESYDAFDSNVLILARIESFAYTRKILTKLESAKWARTQYPRFASLLEKAANAYSSLIPTQYNRAELEEYKNFMIEEIKKGLR